jgi:CRP-like cAMP-binding protein
MAKSPTSPPQNRLLSQLPPDEFERLRPLLRPATLEHSQVVMQPQRPVEYVYFPTTGVISVLTLLEDGRAIEVGNVGKEGAAGVQAAFGVPDSPHQGIVQVPGEALRVEAGAMAKACERDGPLRRLLLRYQAYFLFQVSQSVACNGLHSVAQRCCRWLLMSHDRVEGDVLPLTHEFLAMMLSVRRPSVTLVLQPLQEQGLIRGSRGAITILDRKGLEVAACECHQRVRDEYARVVG